MAYNNPAHEEHHPQFQHPAPIVYYAAPAITYQPTGIKIFGPHFDRNASKGFGATQIVPAITSITAGAMTMAFMAQLCETGVGVWAGVWCLTTGSIAVATGRDPKNSLIKATLVCSVFVVFFSIAQVTIAAIGVSNELVCDSGSFNNNNNYCTDSKVEAILANSILIGTGSLEIIFGICLVAISAHAIKEGSKTQCLTTGSIAVATGRDPKNSLIKATLVCSVFVLFFSIAQVTIAAIGVSNELVCESGSFNNNNYCTDNKVEAILANSILIGTGSLEIIFGICLVAISAHAIKEGSKPQQFATIPVTLAPNQPEPVFMQGPPHPHALQSQPPPYYVRAQHPSTSNPQQQIIYVGVHQPQLTTIKF